MAEPLLALKNVRAGYGDAVVLDNVSFELAERGSLAVLGRNGVGKSTLLLTIMGFTSVAAARSSGGAATSPGMAPHHRARAGIGWVAQEREIFPTLTVEENLTVAARPGPLGPRARSTSCSRASTSGGATRATSSPAASSRCWRSRAR